MPKTERNLSTHGEKSSRFIVGAPVYVKNFSARGDSWLHGYITRQQDRMMYLVQLDNNHVVRRHPNQIRPGSILKSQRLDPDEYDDFLLNKAILEQVKRAAPHLSVSVRVPEEDPEEQPVPEVEPQQRPTSQPHRVEIQVPLRRSTRTRRPPSRFNPD